MPILSVARRVLVTPRASRSARPGVLDRSAGRLLLCAHFGEVAVPVGGGHPAVHEDVAAGDEPPVRAHEQRAHGAYLVRAASAPGRGPLDHAPVPCAARTAEFVLGERGHNDARADRVDPRTTLAPAH